MTLLQFKTTVFCFIILKNIIYSCGAAAITTVIVLFYYQYADLISMLCIKVYYIIVYKCIKI